MIRTPRLVSLLACVVVAVSSAAAETAEEKGWRIAEAADLRDRGWGDAVAGVTMTLVNKHGDETERHLRMRFLENPDPEDGDRSMLIFDQPRDIRGTALLSHAHVLEPDDQWLFLPALKRVKRINSNNKSGPFMGSEFAYEDFSSSGLRKFDYKWVRDERCGKRQCSVLERYPRYENSGYSRQLVWIDQEDLQEQRLEYYDRRNSLLKTLTLSDLRQYLGRYWRAHDMLMENVQTGKSSRMVWQVFQFKTGLGKADFTKASLKRAR